MKTAIYILTVFAAWLMCYGVNLWLETHLADVSTALTLGFLVSIVLAFGSVFAGCQVLDLWGKRI